MRRFRFTTTLTLGLSFLMALAVDSLAGETGGLRRFGAKVEIDGKNRGPIYAAGAEIAVKGTISQNARLMGAIVKVDGDIGDDLWAVGADIDISGEISRNADIWGAKILLNAFVGGAVSILGADIEIGENTAISKKIHASGDQVSFKGAALGPVDLEGREVVFSGSAKTGLMIRAPHVKITDRARINGDVVIHTIGQPDISAGAAISGTVTIESLPQWEVMRRSHGGGLMSRIAFAALVMAGAFITGLFSLGLARGGVEKTIDRLVEQPVKSGIWGIVGLLGIPLIVALLVLTVLGAPLAAALMMTLPLIVLLALTSSGFAIGEWIFNRAGDRMSVNQRILSLLAGLFLIAIGSIVPYVGGLILALTIIFGAGALFLLFRDKFGPEQA